MMWLPEAFPAVTVPVPSLTKAGLSFCSASIEHPCLGNSSLFTTSGKKMTQFVFQDFHGLIQEKHFLPVDIQHDIYILP